MKLVNNKERSSAYQFTYYKDDKDGLKKLKKLRKTISKFNALELETWKYKHVAKVKYRVTIKPRLGKDNPNAVMYKNRRVAQTIKMEHGAYFDVYVQTRD
jgi:hypothetical protein